MMLESTDLLINTKPSANRQKLGDVKVERKSRIKFGLHAVRIEQYKYHSVILLMKFSELIFVSPVKASWHFMLV